MELNDNNPAPFKQPFLTLRTRRAGRQAEDWFVDVDAQIQKYIEKKKPTPLLQTICNHLAAHGYHVAQFGTYEGSGGPSHYLRNGAFFVRMNEELESCKVEEPAVPEPKYEELGW